MSGSRITAVVVALAPALAVGTVVAAVITITPAQHDFGKTLVPRGVALAQFTVASSPGDSLMLSLTGSHAADFVLDGSHTVYCLNSNYDPTTSCPIDVSFRPQSPGIKNATLVVSNRGGQRATASLRGEGVTTVGCQPTLVSCNYMALYTGSIQIRSVDSVLTNDHQARFENDFSIAVANGVVTCSGRREEREKKGYRGKFDQEMRGTGAIAGTGLLAVEFQFDRGRPVYVLTYACPTPRMSRTSTDLNSGNSLDETFPGAPADWRNSEQLADPQPSDSIGMTLLKGRHTNTRYEPENSAGGYTMAMWELKRP